MPRAKARRFGVDSEIRNQLALFEEAEEREESEERRQAAGTSLSIERRREAVQLLGDLARRAVVGRARGNDVTLETREGRHES